MRAIKKASAAKATVQMNPLQDQVEAALAWMQKKSTQRDRDNLARFAIHTTKFFGVSMANLRVLAKSLGRNHELAAALWDTGWYEARMLASLVDEPALVTPAQMDRWCRDFDNWAICDTACFHLFDRTPHAFRKVEQWCDRRDEFARRAAFALLASLALHDKKAADEPFVECLPLIENAASDERNFVKKALVWALRGIAGRNPALNAIVVAVCQRLVESADSTAKWIGRTTLRELNRPASTRRLERQKGAKATKTANIGTKAKPVKLLSGGNPQIAKAYGDAPVQAYIAAMPGWKSEVGRRVDALIVGAVPNVYKAVKWNSPFYGIEGQGWFLGVHCFAKYIKVAFFRGTSLRPVPPSESKQKEVRYIDIHEDDQIDEAQFAAWVKQASELPGERM